MRSTQLPGFSEWESWPHALRKAPNAIGVYVFRIANGECLGRAKGHSDILYIGKGEILKRLQCHHRSRKDQRFWLKRAQIEVGPVEVGWQVFQNRSEAELHESNFLVAYSVEHIELPPGNRHQPLRKFQDTAYAIKQLSAEEQTAIVDKLKDLDARTALKMN